MRPNLIVKYNYSHVHGSSLFMNCCKKKCGTRVCDENGCLSVLPWKIIHVSVLLATF